VVKLRVLAVADTESPFIWDYFDRSLFRGVDLILSCGDLKPSYLSFLTTMVSAPLFYVHGNHDGKMISNPPEGCINLEERMQVMKGVRFIGFGGCNSTSPKPFHYSDQEAARQVTRRMQEISFYGGFDVLVTHAPARGLGDGEDSFHKGFQAYRVLLDLFRPAWHFHGHQHLTYASRKRSIQYGETQIYNAYGYSLLDLHISPPIRRKRISYIKTRYDWGRAYGKESAPGSAV